MQRSAKNGPRGTGKQLTSTTNFAETFPGFPGKSVARHRPATFCTLTARRGAFFHTFKLLAALGTSVTNLGADCTCLITELGAAQHEMQRRLTYFCTVHHKTEMFRLDVLATRFQAMVHGGLQAGLVAMAACSNASLHAFVIGSKHKHGNLLFEKS
ncbi:hypothetical protein SAMN05216386_1095 [Nitrosospira briensis]|uniref:Uncharacterized protein n=1 Tax=Nitrosospira briensis TaxID=35799 RepID=A0A1I4Z927_9PROT|nr:hypothetical protein SAMN05216386_1095 [Nitrosospira briensis]